MADVPLTPEAMPGHGKGRPGLLAPRVWIKKWDKNKDIYCMAVVSGWQRRRGAPQVKEKEVDGVDADLPEWHEVSLLFAHKLCSNPFQKHLLSSYYFPDTYIYKTEQNLFSSLKREVRPLTIPTKQSISTTARTCLCVRPYASYFTCRIVFHILSKCQCDPALKMKKSRQWLIQDSRAI